MGVRNNKNVGLYSGSLYVLSVIAAMSLYLGDGKKANAMVGRVASGLARSLSRASSIASGTSSVSGVSAASSRVSVRNVSGIVQQPENVLPTHKVQHKFGATADTFVATGPIDPNKKYTQYVSDSGTLKTYEKNLGTRFEIFLSDTKVGRDKYVDPTTGRIVSYIYRSKPRWITGADIINAQQSKAQETGSIASGSSGISSLYTSRLNLEMIKNGDGGINFVEKIPEVKVHNPDIIQKAQQIADKLKVNDQNASTGSSAVSGGSAASGTGVGNTTTSSLKLQMVKNQDGNVNFVQETPKVKVNNPDIIQKAQQIASKFKVNGSGLNDRTKATQTDKIPVSTTSTQTDKQGTQQSSVGTVNVKNPQVMIPAAELASKLKVKETSQGSTAATGSQTSKITTLNVQTQSTTQSSSDKSSQTEGNNIYRTELRVQLGGTSTSPDYITSVKNITLKIPTTTDTTRDVTKITGTDTKPTTQQQTGTGGTVKFSNPQVMGPATKIASKLKVEEPSQTPTTTQTTVTPSTGTGTSGQQPDQKFTSTIIITPSPASRTTTTTNVKTQDKTGSSQTAEASGQKKNIGTSSSTGEKGYTLSTLEINDVKSKLKPVSTSGGTTTSGSSSSGALINTKDVSRKDADLQKNVKINREDISGSGSVQVLTKFFETKSDEDKKPKASNTNGTLSINVESKDGKVKISSQTSEVILTDSNVTKLKVDPNFAESLNRKLADGYQERLAQAQSVSRN
ncbi:hypothetical protein [Candidatus Arthromitus sp. SFB-rat-Yit]|uniref:hypothetical protein n=1 Tax=Candidatus Arthromitus sp. SFB-rat-Yit TaxID=1041504 RepID=UPI000227A317|nr:hypothetical protein [Candidatus Arthromitus sp. SFB-rat-Yit]BAK81457.1 hypothetical protein RATSFB_0895 [Candidatus Arthromitus sp. SFB-rat-Yit]